jgi:hypothetical protein
MARQKSTVQNDDVAILAERRTALSTLLRAGVSLATATISILTPAALIGSEASAATAQSPSHARSITDIGPCKSPEIKALERDVNVIANEQKYFYDNGFNPKMQWNVEVDGNTATINQVFDPHISPLPLAGYPEINPISNPQGLNVTIVGQDITSGMWTQRNFVHETGSSFVDYQICTINYTFQTPSSLGPVKEIAIYAAVISAAAVIGLSFSYDYMMLKEWESRSSAP